jgi:peptidoglycan/LPS O-acetylase OafA/YrhL
MSLGLIGLFARYLPHESRTIRYLSDASYWLYLTHLPLVIAAQAVVRDWPVPALLKFVGIVVVATGILLVVYQAVVRYTWLGTLLNGPRSRQADRARWRGGVPAAVGHAAE